MIQLFEARKKQKVEDNELLEKYLKISKQEKEEILKEYKTSENGISEEKGKELFKQNGPNVVVKNEKKSNTRNYTCSSNGSNSSSCNGR